MDTTHHGATGRNRMRGTVAPVGWQWRLAPLAIAGAVSAAVFAAPVLIRLGTLAPDNSPWSNPLRAMAEQIQKTTQGPVRVVVQAGTFSSDAEIISRIAAGGLQAATLTVSGLGELDPAMNIFGIPFFFESDEELRYVQQRITPVLAQRLTARKFHFLNWGNGGWVRVFSKQPIRSLADLKQASLYTSKDDDKMFRWYRENGFHAVQLAVGEMPKQLMVPIGQINAAPSPPVFALAMQFFRDAKYMLDVRAGPLVGATVITEAAWNQMTPGDRDKVTAAAQAVEKKIQSDAPGLDLLAIAQMKAHGLQIITLDAKRLAEFREAADSLTGSASNPKFDMVPKDIFDMAVEERDAFRKTRR